MAKSEATVVTKAIAVEEPAHDTSHLVAKAKLDMIRANAEAKTVETYILTQSVWDLLAKHGGKDVSDVSDVDGMKSVCGVPCKVLPTRAEAIRETNRHREGKVGAIFV